MRLQGCTAATLHPYTTTARQATQGESRIWGHDDFGIQECRLWRDAMKRAGRKVEIHQRDIKAGGFRLPVIIAIATA